MRELKFRAYLKDSYPYFRRDMEKIVEVKSIHLNPQSIIITTYHGNVSVPFEYVEIMQFTGLLDKNGKEIYEGDIVLAGTMGQGIVFFEYGCFWIRLETDKITDILWNFEVEVIGNIYEEEAFDEPDSQ